MTRTVIAKSVYLGDVHHASAVTDCAQNKEVVKRVIIKHLKPFSVLAHRHIFVLLMGVLLQVTPHCESLQKRFPETPGCRLPGTNGTSGEKLNTANTETSIYNHL